VNFQSDGFYIIEIIVQFAINACVLYKVKLVHKPETGIRPVF
jgi:hypothetical protein